MSKDRGRPWNLKSHIGTSKVKVVCKACLEGFHDECLGRAVELRVRCHCDYFNHKEDQ